MFRFRFVFMLLGLALNVATIPVYADDAPKTLRFSSYATSSSVQKMADDPTYLESAPDVLRTMHVSKIILEVYRSGHIVTPETLIKVRDFFHDKGFAVWGGIATVPGGDFGVLQIGDYGWFNWQAEKTQADLLRVMQDIAPVFDTFIVDDFLCSDDKSELSNAVRGDRSWGEYRRDLMVSLSRSLFIDPLKAAKPDGTVIIKYPQWYDRFHLFGYDVERQPQLFDQVWVGTETRGQYTQRFGFTQPYEGFVNFRWLSGIAGAKKGGAWFDYGDCDENDFVEQAYQTVLAGAQDIVFFNFNNIETGHPGNDLLQEHFEPLEQLAAHVAKHPVSGIPAYKPMNSDPGPDMYLLDFLGMLGIPVVPTHEFPDGADTLFLPTQAAHDPMLLEKMEAATAAGKSLVLTTGLLIAKPELNKFAGLEVPLVSTPAKADSLYVGKKTFELQKPLDIECAYQANDTRIAAIVDGKSQTFLGHNKYNKSHVYILNTHTYDQADFDKVGEVLLCPRPLGILELPDAALTELRAAFNSSLDFTLNAPSRVCIQPLGDTGYFIHNYNREETSITLEFQEGIEELTNVFTGETTLANKGQLGIILPARSRIWLSKVPDKQLAKISDAVLFEVQETNNHTFGYSDANMSIPPPIAKHSSCPLILSKTYR